MDQRCLIPFGLPSYVSVVSSHSVLSEHHTADPPSPGIPASTVGTNPAMLNMLLSEQGYATSRRSAAAHSTKTPGSRTLSAVAVILLRLLVGSSQRKQDLPTTYGPDDAGAISLRTKDYLSMS